MWRANRKSPLFEYEDAIGQFTPATGVLTAVVQEDVDDYGALLFTLADQFDFPGYFGMNWDALWDCLGSFYWTELKSYMIIHRRLPTGLGKEPPRRAARGEAAVDHGRA